jgi:hypothetical protein
VKHFILNLTKDEVLQLRRGGKMHYYVDSNTAHIEIRGPIKYDKGKGIPASKKKIPVQG